MPPRAVKYLPEHLFALKPQKAQSFISDYLKESPEYAHLIDDMAYTLMVDDEVIFCGGLLHMHEGVGEVWTVIGENFKQYSLSITRHVITFLHNAEALGYRRLQTTVASGFPEAARWAGLLGFESEGLMRKYTPAGEDCFMYARIS